MRTPDRIPRLPAALLALTSPLLPVLVASAAGAQPALTGRFEEIGRLEAPCSSAVAVWPPFVLVGTERGLLVQDVGNPEQPLTTYALDLGGGVRAITVRGDTALAEMWGARDRLIDLAAPGGPAWQEAPEGFAFPDLRVDGRDYIVRSEGQPEGDELRVYRLDGETLALAGVLPVAGEHREIAVDGDRAYVLTHLREGATPQWLCRIVAVSLADPAAPDSIGCYRTAWAGAWDYQYYAAWRLAARDGTVYSLESLWEPLAFTLKGIDFVDPAAPSVFRQVGAGRWGGVPLLDVTGERVCVSASASGGAVVGFRVIDVADPALWRNLAVYEYDGARLLGLAQLDDFVLCATDRALRVIELPAVVGRPPTDHGYSHPYLLGQQLALGRGAAHALDVQRVASPYYSEYRAYLTAVDLRDPAAPAIADTQVVFYPLLADPEDFLRATDDALYLGRPWLGDLLVYDLADPLHPEPAGLWPAAPDIVDLTVDGDRLAVAHAAGARFYTREQPIPAMPTLRGEWSDTDGCAWAVWRDSLAVAAVGLFDDRRSLFTLDLSAPEAPVELGRGEPECHLGDFVLLDDRLYGLNEEPGYHGAEIFLYDLAAPDALALLASDWLEHGFGNLARPPVVCGHVCTSSNYGLVTVDWGELSDARPVAERRLGWQVTAVAARGDTVAALGRGVLSVMRYLPDVVPPRLALEVVPAVDVPGRVRAVLTADEPLDPARATIVHDGAPLPATPAPPDRLTALLPEGPSGRRTLAAAACDAAGNPAAAALSCAVGAVGPAGGRLVDPVLGLELELPPGAVPEPVGLVLLEAADAKAPGDSVVFRLLPAGLDLARPATLTVPLAPGSVPVLQRWAGVAWADYRLQLDRGSGTARALVDRLGSFRLLRAEIPPPAPRTRLLPAAPNPFNARTNLAFELAAEGPVTLRLYDLRGRLVRTLHDGVLAAGRHGFDWDGRDDAGQSAGSGVYFYRLRSRGADRSGRCVLVK